MGGLGFEKFREFLEEEVDIEWTKEGQGLGIDREKR